MSGLHSRVGSVEARELRSVEALQGVSIVAEHLHQQLRLVDELEERAVPADEIA